tara:strand:+ start:801 stop:1619 length:819 start_codon:yes stop_codon:yes gene_type:complete
MYNLNINNDNISINVLEKFMLNSIKHLSVTSENMDINKISKPEKPYIPKSNIYVNYNKAKSKYNENVTKKYNFSDKLFWYFYKLYNNVSDEELEYINPFTSEKKFKMSIIEKIKLNKELLKKHKIQRNFVESEITNDKHISLYSLKTLCILYNINILIIKDNNTYTRFTNNNLENTIDNLDNYHTIKLVYKNTSSISNNFQLLSNIDKSEVLNALNKFYYVKNLDKPLKSFSTYKLNEIIEIAEKLVIPIYQDSGKKKIKMELYSDALKILS